MANEQYISKIVIDGELYDLKTKQSDWEESSSTDPAYIKNKPTIGTAAERGVDTTPTSGSDNLITSDAVYNAIDQIPNPMVFKGTVGTNGTTTGTIATLPTNGSANIGDTYKVLFDGTYASIAAKEGDTFICLTKTSNSNTWEIIPSGDETGSGSGTVTAVQAGAGLHVDNQTSGGTISSRGTLNLNLKSTTQSSLTATEKGDASNREYAVGLDSNGKLSVNVPWTDTTDYNNLINTPTLGAAASLDMDSSLSNTSTNPVQNKVIYTALRKYVPINGSNILNNSFEPERNESAELGSSSYQFKHIYANEGHLQSIYLANETTPTITYNAQKHRVTIPTDIVSNTTAANGTVALLNAVMHPENGETYKEESIVGTDSIKFQYKKGTTSEIGYAGFILGNSIVEGDEWNASGEIAIYNKNGYYTEIMANENSVDNYWVTLPNKTGTLACLSDLTDTKVNVIARGTTKAYLLGTTTSPTSSNQAVTSVAETGVYLDTAGELHATTFEGNLSGNIDHTNTDPTSAAGYGLTFHPDAGTTGAKALRTNGSVRVMLYNNETTGGYARLTLGNNTAATSGGKNGIIQLFGESANRYCTLTCTDSKSLIFDNDSQTGGTNFSPAVTETYDLGTTSLKWRNIYANNIYGAFNGALTGNVNHTLVNPTTSTIYGLTFHDGEGSTGTKALLTNDAVSVAVTHSTTGGSSVIISGNDTAAASGGKYGATRLYTRESTYVQLSGNTSDTSMSFSTSAATAGNSLRPGTTNIYDLGTSSYKWRNVYATNINTTSITTPVARAASTTTPSQTYDTFTFSSDIRGKYTKLKVWVACGSLSYLSFTEVLVPESGVGVVSYFFVDANERSQIYLDSDGKTLRIPQVSGNTTKLKIYRVECY